MNDPYTTLVGDTHFGFLDRDAATAQVLHPRLIRNSGELTMLRVISAELKRSTAFTFSVAFVTPGGLALLKQDLLDFRGRGTLITSTYLGFNDPAVFRELLQIPNLDVRVIDSPEAGFHAKGYIFDQTPEVTAIVGSSNLTRTALLVNDEWNLRFSAMPGGDIVHQLRTATERQIRTSIPLTPEWIDTYEQAWTPRVPAPVREAGLETVMPSGRIEPNEMQTEALAELDLVRDQGESRALIVSATGTGKTILAALAARRIGPARMLFLAHREQILDKARTEFARVFETTADSFGRLAGGRSELHKSHVFATVQTLARPDVLSSLDPETFDLIIIDEVHRSGGATYRRIIDHFTPQFLLGLTATPERTDDFNVFELFNFTVPYEIRLQDALKNKMLAPFNYYGVEDYVTSSGETMSDASGLQNLVACERVAHIIHTLETYGHASGAKGLMFCGRNEEARELSTLLNERRVHGRCLRTVALSGTDSIQARDDAVADLEAGRIDYILTVDIFNEGIDIPSVNQVVMLRRTQSSIVFTQQLGRGLRKAVGKDHLRVIDFIGNYDNNFLIPIALFGDSSLNKDVIRKRLLEAEQAGAIAGVSSINFQEVARERIFASLAQAKLDSIPNLKRAVSDLEQRLGHTPQLLDFARFDTVDPVVIATKRKCYWDLLIALKKMQTAPSPTERNYLVFLSTELLNGKRPHELIVLRALLDSADGALSYDQLHKALRDADCPSDGATFRSLLRILAFEFATDQDRGRFGTEPIIEYTDAQVSLHPAFADVYGANPTFCADVDDVLETGLFIARHRYGWQSTPVVGERYSRKDVCRLLNWQSNQQGVMYGYKVDLETNTCPIFVTYHKDDEVSESTAYADEFLDPHTLKWFTRSKRNLQSDEVQSILSREKPPALHIFVKKDDAESGEFYYLGEAAPREAEQTTMPQSDGKELSVVTMKLDLESPVETALFEYLTTSGVLRAAEPSEPLIDAERTSEEHTAPALW
ncbi:DEAD/DEAH box helicase [Brachybacterium nesterenkovii]|uniref:DEAD/DEAH box helicase n=1 Tax=Brachybacterium nesterenkovii TaxID=47847 RepID=UPI00321B1D5C